MSEIAAKITSSPSGYIDPEAGGYQGSVDAEIYRGGEYLCDVTLLPHEQTGDLDAWGDPSHWCSHVDVLDSDGEVRKAIVAAVRDALRGDGTQSVIDFVKSRGGDPRDFRDAVHEAIHGMQLETEDWSRSNLTLIFDEDVDRAHLFAWECEARAAEWLACERVGIEYNLEKWAGNAAIESAKQGMPFSPSMYMNGIERAKERDAPRLLAELEELIAKSSQG